jgi:hypothetical protein
MKAIRISTITLSVAALLWVSVASATTAQEEAQPMPAPAPGEPFAGVLSGSLSFELLEAPTEECPLGVKTITDAAGSSTIGDVTLHAEHCPTVGLPTVPAGVQTITTTEGDELTGAYFVDCLPLMPTAPSGEPITCIGRFAATGGTGMFTDATGSVSETTFVWFPGSLESQGWPWLAKLEGTIDY